MSTPNGGDAAPVTVSTQAPTGLIAIPVWGYTLATLPAGIDVEGGNAEPVYLVSSAELASGAYVLRGDQAVMRIVSGTGRPAIGAVAPTPVYLVGGAL